MAASFTISRPQSESEARIESLISYAEAEFKFRKLILTVLSAAWGLAVGGLFTLGTWHLLK